MEIIHSKVSRWWSQTNNIHKATMIVIFHYILHLAEIYLLIWFRETVKSLLPNVMRYQSILHLPSEVWKDGVTNLCSKNYCRFDGLPWNACPIDGSSRPLLRSGIGAITDGGKLRLCTTPCALRGGNTSTAHQKL